MNLGSASFCKFFHAALKAPTHGGVVQMGNITSLLSSCLRNFDLVPSKHFLMRGALLFCPPPVGFQTGDSQNQYAAGDKVEE